MKKSYLHPATIVVRVGIEQMVAESVHSVCTNLGSNATISYGGGSNGAARVKDAGYSVWDEDWSE